MSASIYVSNLAAATTEEALATKFAEFGTVLSVKLAAEIGDHLFIRHRRSLDQCDPPRRPTAVRESRREELVAHARGPSTERTASLLHLRKRHRHCQGRRKRGRLVAHVTARAARLIRHVSIDRTDVHEVEASPVR